jgi:hypothetical protein
MSNTHNAGMPDGLRHMDTSKQLIKGLDVDITQATAYSTHTIADADLILLNNQTNSGPTHALKCTVGTLKGHITASIGSVLSIDNADDGDAGESELTLANGALNFLHGNNIAQHVISAGTSDTDDINVTIATVNNPTFSTSVSTPLITTTADLTFRIDDDGGDTSKFAFKNGADSEIAAIDESGNLTLSGTVDGIDIATDVAANTLKETNATHAGDVSGATTLTIEAGAVTLAKMENRAADTFIGRKNSAGTGSPQEMSKTEALTVLGGGAGSSGNFLQYDGSWVTPPNDNTQLSDADVMDAVIDSINITNGTLANAVSLRNALGYLEHRVAANDSKDSCDSSNTLSALAGMNNSGSSYNIGANAADTANFTGHVTVAGNLTISGTTTTVNTTDLAVSDKLITLADGSNSAGAASGAGIEIDTDNSTKQPTLEWTNTSGLAQWGLYQEGDNTSYPIAVMTSMAGAGTAPSGNKAGVGTFCYNTDDDALYIRTE